MKEYKYKYEMHLHTADVSKCGVTPACDYIKYYADRGYTGICTTDHFFNANVTPEIRAEKSWANKVEMFCRGYENAKKAAQGTGLDVFFGWEYAYGWAHLLTYGLSGEWLLSHPDVCDWNVEDYLDKVHEDGGYVVHAHPFRDKIETVHLFPDKVDAVEVMNTTQSDKANKRALCYARMLGLPKTSGSDMHNAVEGRRLGCVESQIRFESVSDYGKLLNGKKIKFEVL